MWYTDIAISGTGPSFYIAANRVFNHLHGLFRSIGEDHGFFLTLPVMANELAGHDIKGKPYLSVIRLFHEKPEDAAILEDGLSVSRNPDIRLKVSRKVPDGFDGPYCAFRRLQIPGRQDPVKRVRAIHTAAENRLPYFKTKSISSGQLFSIIVAPELLDLPGSGTPDSYGLSRKMGSPVLPI